MKYPKTTITCVEIKELFVLLYKLEEHFSDDSRANAYMLQKADKVAQVVRLLNEVVKE